MWKSPCNRDSDCLEDSHMWCYEVPDGGICRCQPGFSYNAIIKICEPGITTNTYMKSFTYLITIEDSFTYLKDKVDTL